MVTTSNALDSKRLTVYLLIGVAVCTFITRIYVQIWFADVMPHSPQPMTGRVYREMAAFGTAVYLNKSEVHFMRALDIGFILSIGLLFVVYYLRNRLKWA